MIDPDKPFQTTGSTPIEGRYVVVFDAAAPGESGRFGLRALEDEVPTVLEDQGFDLENYFPRLGIAVVDGDSAGTGIVR